MCTYYDLVYVEDCGLYVSLQYLDVCVYGNE